MKFLSNYEVLTSNGFKDFFGIKKVKSNKGLKFTTKDGSTIQVTPSHKFYENGFFKVASTYKEGDFLCEKLIVKIDKIFEEDEYFDLIEVTDGNHYTTSNFESSNCAFIRTQNWEEFADSIFPSQGALSWKKNIIISTANGINHFYEIVERAKLSTLERNLNGKEDGTVLVDVDWKEVPRYRSDGTVMPPEEFKEKIIKKFGKVYFEQNYGNNFMGSTETLWDSQALESIKIQAPLEEWKVDEDNGLKVYELPDPTKVYIFGVDAAKDGRDFFAVQVMDITEFPFKQVASGAFSVNYLEMPVFLNDWGLEYNNALMVVENNEGAGQSVVDTLYTFYQYPNLYFDNGKDFPGFRTTQKTRGSLLNLHKVLANSGKIEVKDKATYEELQKFEKVGTKFQASNGHDDLVMALSLTLCPLMSLENFEDYGKFLASLKEKQNVETSSFLINLSEMNFADI